MQTKMQPKQLKNLRKSSIIMKIKKRRLNLIHIFYLVSRLCAIKCHWKWRKRIWFLIWIRWMKLVMPLKKMMQRRLKIDERVHMYGLFFSHKIWQKENSWNEERNKEYWCVYMGKLFGFHPCNDILLINEFFPKDSLSV